MNEKKINYNLSQLDKCISVDFNSFYDKILNRQTKILEGLNKQQCNELLNQLLSNIFNLQVKIWKNASDCLTHSSKLYEEGNKNFKDTCDQIKLC